MDHTEIDDVIIPVFVTLSYPPAMLKCNCLSLSPNNAQNQNSCSPNARRQSPVNNCELRVVYIKRSAFCRNGSNRKEPFPARSQEKEGPAVNLSLNVSQYFQLHECIWLGEYIGIKSRAYSAIC